MKKTGKSFNFILRFLEFELVSVHTLNTLAEATKHK